MSAFRRDPAEIRAWAEEHGIEVADAPEPAPGEPEPGPGSEPVTGPGTGPAGTLTAARWRRLEQDQLDQVHRARVQARAGLDQLARDRESATMARRLARLRAELGEYQGLIAERKAEAGALANQVARLTREADQLEQRARDTRAHTARQAAEDERAAALARRVVQVLEGDRELDPFTSALAALAQQKRRRGEVTAGDDPQLAALARRSSWLTSRPTGEDDPRLAALAEAVQGAAERQAAVRQLQVRQITVNKNHGPDSAEADAVRRELAAERLAMAVLATLGTGLSGDDVISVALTGALPDRAGPPRLLTGPGWPVTG